MMLFRKQPGSGVLERALLLLASLDFQSWGASHKQVCKHANAAILPSPSRPLHICELYDHFFFISQKSV